MTFQYLGGSGGRSYKSSGMQMFLNLLNVVPSLLCQPVIALQFGINRSINLCNGNPLFVSFKF